MYEEILKSLKTKYSNLGLSESYLKVVARRLAKTVETQEAVESAVTEVEGELKLAQVQADKQRTLEAELKKLREMLENGGGEPNPNEPNDSKPTPTPAGEDAPDWAKALAETQTKLAETIAQLQVDKVQQSNQEILLAKLKEAEVSESFYKYHVTGRTFETPEQINEFVATISEDYKAFKQENANEGLRKISGSMFAPTDGSDKGVSGGAKAYVKQNLKAE